MSVLGSPLPGGAENCPLMCNVQEWCQETRSNAVTIVAETRLLLEAPDLADMLFSGELTPSTELLDPAEQDLSNLPKSETPVEELVTMYRSADKLLEHAREIRQRKRQTLPPDEADFRTTIELAGERIVLAEFIGTFVTSGCATGPKVYPSFKKLGTRYTACGAGVAFRFYDVMATIRDMMSGFNTLREQGQNPDPIDFAI